MGMFSAFDITATGLSAQRYRMDIISENVANANTTRTEDGTPYRRKVVTFATQDTDYSNNFGHVLDRIVGDGRTSNVVTDDAIGYGVKITQISEDHATEMNMVYDPSHPETRTVM